jgi:hypothetical protein
MNIFFVERDPLAAARSLCDKHVVKMTLETAQILSTVMGGPYKPTHAKHPSTVWAATQPQWVYLHFLGLLSEYKHRYGRTHKCATIIHQLPLLPPDQPWTDPPQCMPEQFKQSDTVEAYRAYYRGDKARFARWTLRTPPEWFFTSASYGVAA